MLQIAASGPTREWLQFFAVGMFGFFVLRVGLLISHLSKHGGKFQTRLLVPSFAAGLKPDLMMLGFITLLPVAFALIFYVILADRKITIVVRKIAIYIAFAVYCVALTVGFIDMEFWPIFGERVNSALLGWLETPLVSIGVAAKSFSLVGYTLILILLIISLAFILKSRLRIGKSPDPAPGFFSRVVLALALLTVVSWSARGTFEERRAIEIGASFFSDDIVANQLTLNSGLNLALSIYNERGLQDSFLLNDPTRQPTFERNTCAVPLDGKVKGNGRNVFLIIVESLTAKGIKSLDGLQTPYLSPELDALIASGTTYPNFYSNNSHTGHALFNIFTGIPNPPGPALTSTRYGAQDRLTWLRQLKSVGYHTAFFMTHTPLFDNMLGFLRTSGASEIVSVDDYDSKFPRGPWGVFDEVMFDEVLARFKAHKANVGGPVSYVMLTSTNHTPWEFLPDPLPFEFKAERGEDKTQYKAYRYTDWAIGNFVRKIQAEDPGAIILITGDHGQLLAVKNKRADLVSNYFHVPLIVLAKNHPLVGRGVRPARMGSHIDLGPTIMELLNLPLDLPGMGQSLFTTNTQNTFAPLVLNDGLGMIDKSYFYFYFQNGLASLVNSTTYTTDGTVEEANRYRTQLLSTFQGAYWLLEHPGGACK